MQEYLPKINSFQELSRGQEVRGHPMVMRVMWSFRDIAVLLLTVQLCIDVEALDFAANDGHVRVHQRTTVTRRRRDVHGSNAVEFPETMTFDMNNGVDVHTLTLTQKSDFHSHARVFDANGEIESYHWVISSCNESSNRNFSRNHIPRTDKAYIGIYEDADNNAVVAVNCNDTAGCSLQGSFDMGSTRYKIDPPKQRDDQEVHRVRRADSEKPDDPNQNIVLEFDADGTVHVSKEEGNPNTNDEEKVETDSTEQKSTEDTWRRKRDTPANCAIVEISLVVDYEAFEYFLAQANNNVMAAQSEAILFLEIAVAEVNLRLCNFGQAGCCSGECIKVYATDINVPTVYSDSWTKGLAFIPNSGGKEYLLLPKKMYACNAASAASADLVVCVTGLDLSVLLSDGKYHAYREEYYSAWAGTVCQSTSEPTRGVVDFFQDNIALSIANLVGRVLDALPDYATSCNPWNYIMGHDYWLSDHSYMQYPWHFSSCSCNKMCNYINYHRTCLSTVSFTDAKWDAFILRTYDGQGGQVYDLDHQCDLVYPGSCACTVTDSSAICSNGIGCDIPYYGCNCKVRVRAGTPCGHGKWCLKGSCVCYDAILNEECCSSASCVSPYTTCTGSPSTCQCATNYQEVSGSCDPIDGDCTVPGFCISDSTCIAGICKCNSGYFAIGGVCLPESNPGGSCVVGQCADKKSSCVCNVCVCNGGYVAVGGVCVPGECTSAAGCYVANEVCLNNYCLCANGFHRTSAGLCIANIVLGGGCTSSCQCGPQFSYCDLGTGICVCDGNHLDSNGPVPGGTCVSVGDGGLNEACVGCSCTVPNSECVSNVCKCVDPFQEVDGGCSVGLGDACQGGDCTDPNAECVSLDETCDDVCQCKDGYTPFVTASKMTCSSDCVEQVVVGGDCDETIVDICENPDSVVCVNGICRCVSPFTFDAIVQTCVRTPKNYGETCTCEDWCVPEATVVCDTETETCLCRTGFVYDAASLSCNIAGIFGDPCESGSSAMSCADPFKCLGLPMTSDKACQCPGTHIYDPVGMTCV